MQNLTASIDFCRVTQIYFPLSASFYRDQFPADDPNNCQKETEKVKKVENCRGEADTYGNFREARIGKLTLKCRNAAFNWLRGRNPSFLLVELVNKGF